MRDNSKQARERAEARFQKAQKASNDSDKAKTESAAATLAFDGQRARLKSLRLAKEAAEMDPEAQKAKKAKKKPTPG